MDYCIRREYPGFTVWSCGLSGSKRDCLGWFTDRRTARRYITQQLLRGLTV